MLTGGTAEGSFAVLHGLYWAVLNLAEARPALLVVRPAAATAQPRAQRRQGAGVLEPCPRGRLALDDLQWSDRPSLRFVA